MRLELLVVPECPNGGAAADLFRASLAAAGVGADVATIVVTDQDTAIRLGFTGSPSFFLDGHDLLPDGGPPGVACRLYTVHGNLAGLPEQQALIDAIGRTTRPG